MQWILRRMVATLKGKMDELVFSCIIDLVIYHCLYISFSCFLGQVHKGDRKQERRYSISCAKTEFTYSGFLLFVSSLCKHHPHHNRSSSPRCRLQHHSAPRRAQKNMTTHKRPHNGDGYSSASKRHHHSSETNSYHRPSQSHRDRHDRNRNNNNIGPPSSAAADTTTTNSTSTTTLPPLPPIKPQYQKTAFCHKSLYTTSRELATSDLTYERLEFLGDAYIELFASRLIYESYSHLPAGRMSQVRELLVKNETLAELSRSYGFDQKIAVGAEIGELVRDSRGKGNKGYNKIVGDVFEAYVAAVVLSDFEGKGFEKAEAWCRELWEAKLERAKKEDKSLLPPPPPPSPLAARRDDEAKDEDEGKEEADDNIHLHLLRTTYDPNAKATLQKRIYHQPLIRLFYETDRPTIELKGDQKGQNLHFIALYVEEEASASTTTTATAADENIPKKTLLAKGQGKNKVEAGNWAAVEAMYGPMRQRVEELEGRVREEKARRAREREEGMKG